MALPVLRTPRLVLRPFVPEDASRVKELVGEKDVASPTLNIPHPYLDGMAEEWIANQAAACDRGESANFAITSRSDGLIGSVGLRLVLPHRRAELGYWIGKPYWGKGYATEAARAAVEWAFSTLDLNRIHASYFARNPGSGRVLEKIGMKPEGISRQHILRWGAFEDLVRYGLLRSELTRSAG